MFDLDRFLPYRLNRASEAIAEGFAREYRKRYGMTRPEWRTLAALGQMKSLSSKEVGAHGAMHKTKVSRAVTALEGRRWLVRAPDTADRRVEHLSLTPAGEAVYRDLAALAEAYQADLADRLGREAYAAIDAGVDAILRLEDTAH